MVSRRLEGKVALITGATGGIGAAAAKLFAREGAALIITDLCEQRLQELHAELRVVDADVLAVSGDLTDERFVKMLFGLVAQRFGRLRILYNNAGKMVAGSINEVTASDLCDAVTVNLIAQAIAVKHAVELLKTAEGAAIVNKASMGGHVGFSGMIAYTASKSAIIGTTKSLAVELIKDNIRVNAIAPGIVDTQMPRALLNACAEGDRAQMALTFSARQLMKRFARPDEIAQAALFLSSDDSSFITGVILPVDGGWSCW